MLPIAVICASFMALSTFELVLNLCCCLSTSRCSFNDSMRSSKTASELAVADELLFELEDEELEEDDELPPLLAEPGEGEPPASAVVAAWTRPEARPPPTLSATGASHGAPMAVTPAASSGPPSSLAADSTTPPMPLAAPPRTSPTKPNNPPPPPESCFSGWSGFSGFSAGPDELDEPDDFDDAACLAS